MPTPVRSKIRVCLVNLINPKYAKTQGPFPVQVLAGYLGVKMRHAEVKILDMNRDVSALQEDHGIPREKASEITADIIAREIAEERPDIVGLSMKWGTLDAASRIIAGVKATAPDQPLFVLGSNLPTFAPEHLLAREEFKDALLVRGEGEEALRQIIEKAFSNPNMLHELALYRDIPNIAYRDHLNGQRMNMDLANYPDFGQEFVNDEFFPEYMPLEASRGCYYNACKYCSVKKLYGMRAWRPFNADWVLTLIERFAVHQHDKGQRPEIVINDSEFLGPSYTPAQLAKTLARANKLISGIIAINGRLGLAEDKRISIFQLSLRVSDIYSKKDTAEMKAERRKFLELLKEANVERVYVGVESGSPTQLQRYGKGFTPEDSEKAIAFLNEVGLPFEPGFIFWDEHSNRAELQENIAFIERTGIYRINSRIFNAHRPQAGSDMTEKLKKEGLIKGDLNLNNLSYESTFKDPEVAGLHMEWKQWDDQTRDLIHGVGHVRRWLLKGDETNRSSLFKIMLRIRELDFLFVKEIVCNDSLEGRINVLLLLSQLLQETKQEIDRIKKEKGKDVLYITLENEYLPKAIRINQALIDIYRSEIQRI